MKCDENKNTIKFGSLPRKHKKIRFKCLNYSDACDVGIDWVEIAFSDAMDQNKALGMKCDWYLIER